MLRGRSGEKWGEGVSRESVWGEGEGAHTATHSLPLLLTCPRSASWLVFKSHVLSILLQPTAYTLVASHCDHLTSSRGPPMSTSARMPVEPGP